MLKSDAKEKLRAAKKNEATGERGRKNACEHS